MQIRSFQAIDSAGVKSLISSIMNKEFVTEEKAYRYKDLDDISCAYGKLREKFLVVEENDGIIATAGVKEDSDTTALLRRLFVHPSHRSRDIGSMLVDTILDFCKMNDYKWVTFRATLKMKAAIALLTTKKGFVEKERHTLDGVEVVILHYKIR